MSIESLVADIRNAQRRIEKNAVVDLNEELSQNLYPLLGLIAAELEEHDGAIEELTDALDTEGSYIEEELGVAILTAFGVAESIADEIDKLDIQDDLVKKRLATKIEDWHNISKTVAKDIRDAMPGDDDDEDDDEGEED